MAAAIATSATIMRVTATSTSTRDIPCCVMRRFIVAMPAGATARARRLHAALPRGGQGDRTGGPISAGGHGDVRGSHRIHGADWREAERGGAADGGGGRQVDGTLHAGTGARGPAGLASGVDLVLPDAPCPAHGHAVVAGLAARAP